MAERALRMREAPGSKPGVSTFAHFVLFWTTKGLSSAMPLPPVFCGAKGSLQVGGDALGSSSSRRNESRRQTGNSCGDRARVQGQAENSRRHPIVIKWRKSSAD